MANVNGKMKIWQILTVIILVTLLLLVAYMYCSHNEQDFLTFIASAFNHHNKPSTNKSQDAKLERGQLESFQMPTSESKTKNTRAQAEPPQHVRVVMERAVTPFESQTRGTVKIKRQVLYKSHSLGAIAEPLTRETQMRRCLEKMFAKSFIKVRPSFLINPETGRRLELDAYNQELQLAVEFNGIQHMHFPNPFHANRAQFDAQLRRDKTKASICKNMGITLVVVPNSVKRDEMCMYLSQNVDVQRIFSQITNIYNN
jgi:hypothetical protein